MADETPGSAPPAAAPSSATDVGGGTLRVTPGQTPGSEGPTLEEQAAQQEQANETPEQKAEREAGGLGGASEAGGDDESADGEPKPFDFTGSIFEGLSEEMQGKVAPFAAAYAENGTLTDAEVAEAAKATGFSEAAVRQFMAGAPATAAAAAAPVLEAFGGMDNYRQFQDWTKAEGRLTPAEESTINKAINAGDYETAAQLMQAPMARWKADGGGQPARDVTNNPQGSQLPQGDVYDNWAQVTRDQGKPEYRNDPAFRKKVEDKIARSPNI
jgi:hypothetical protein